jgi:hypothetical protein
MMRWLQLLARPVKHRADWYYLNGFPPDKLSRRYPKQLCECADEIESLNNAMANDQLYRHMVTFMSNHPALARLGPAWFGCTFKNLPTQLRLYAAAISHIQFCIQRHAPKAAKRARSRISVAPEEFIYYIRRTTGRYYYEDVANILDAECPDRFGEIDADALRKKFQRSEYAEKIRQLKTDAFRSYLLRPRSA